MGLGCQPCEAFGPVPPASPVDGALWVDSSSGPPYQLYRWNLGAGAWEKVGAIVGSVGGAQGFVVPITPPAPAASWTLVNGATATLVDQAPGLVLSSPGNGGTIIAAVRAAPATPYKRVLAFAVQTDFGAPCCAGFAFRNAASGSMVLHGFDRTGSTGLHQNWTNPTAFAGGVAGAPIWDDRIGALGLMWLRMGDTGALRTLELSGDGQNWIQRYTEAHNQFVVADQVGFFLRAGGVCSMSVADFH